MYMLKTVIFVFMTMIFVQDACPSGMPVPGRGIASTQKNRRRVSSAASAAPSPSPDGILASYSCISDGLRKFLKEQIDYKKGDVNHLSRQLISELLLCESQLDARPLHELVSLMTSIELYENDIKLFTCFGKNLAYFTQLKTLRLFCSGLTPEKFPDLSALPLTRLELWFYSPELPPADKLPKTLVEITLNGKEFMRE